MIMKPANIFDKNALVNAIHAIGFPSMEAAAYAEKEGYATISGDQVNPVWNWDRDRLREMGVEDLRTLYQGMTRPAQ